MSLKERINTLFVLKNMLIQAHEKAKTKEELRQGLIYNPGFGNEHLCDDVPSYDCTGFLLVKRTRKDGVKFL